MAACEAEVSVEMAGSKGEEEVAAAMEMPE